MRAAASFVTRRLQAASNAASAKRGMASHGGSHGKEYPFGMHFHVSPVHKNLGLAYGTMLWLWIFYRAKEDGRVVLGLEHPWDHGHGGHDDHAHHAHGGAIQYTRAEIGERPSLVKAAADDEEEEDDDE
ncbi:hypothetical protein PybrP1_002397 [[Pythium] brassicae (nom. inval.)]|nr:hypothetical protein PybrP1_002397 [[Pythium] brassicae (nom. inval.)]